MELTKSSLHNKLDMSDKKEQPASSFFSPKSEPKEEQPKEEKPKSSGGYQGRRPNKVCNDGKDWKDFH
jgi:hypothetical protein